MDITVNTLKLYKQILTKKDKPYYTCQLYRIHSQITNILHQYFDVNKINDFNNNIYNNYLSNINSNTILHESEISCLHYFTPESKEFMIKYLNIVINDFNNSDNEDITFCKIYLRKLILQFQIFLNKVSNSHEHQIINKYNNFMTNIGFNTMYDRLNFDYYENLIINLQDLEQIKQIIKYIENIISDDIKNEELKKKIQKTKKNFTLISINDEFANNLLCITPSEWWFDDIYDYILAENDIYFWKIIDSNNHMSSGGTRCKPWEGLIKPIYKKHNNYIDKIEEWINMSLEEKYDKITKEWLNNTEKRTGLLIFKDNNRANQIYIKLENKIKKKKETKIITEKKIIKEPKLVKPVKPKPVKEKKKAIPKKIKILVWNKYIGEDEGSSKCLCCKVTKITQMNFVCGHILSESHGGEITIDNLRPICSECNSSMGTTNMNDFIKKHKLH
jgi:5-methylcytosine-specific restriction endonuclease McrA